MMIRAIVCISLVLAVVVTAKAPKWHELTARYSYDQYLEDFDKTRMRPQSERAVRRGVFERRLSSILAHNADASQTYKQGVNKFADYTDEELSHVLMATPKTPSVAAAPTALPPRNATASRRKAFDWRSVTPSVLTTVKDQGDCGSCWAHGTTEGVESQEALVNGELFVLSQQQLVSCSPTFTRNLGPLSGNESMTLGACGGYIPNYAIEHLMAGPFKGQMAEEWENPYRSYWNMSRRFNTTIKYPTCERWMHEVPMKTTVTGYDFVPRNDALAMEDAIVSKGPVVILMAVYNSFMYYEQGVYSDPGCEGKQGVMPPSHVVNLVGFGTDADLDADYWVLRNSWSASWGENGFARIARPKQEPCGQMLLPSNWTTIEDFGLMKTCGMCGILNYAFVPTVKRV